ncbi:hypothetical protein Tco_1453937, partial [Tanacetum coccineum]
YESFKIIYQGKVYWIRAKEVTGWVPEFVEDIEKESDMEENIKEGNLKAEDGGFPFVEGDSDVEGVPETEYAEDSHNNNMEDGSDSLKYPPGFTPTEVTKGAFGGRSQSMHVEEKECATESFCSGHFKKSKAPRTGGSILQLIDDLVKDPRYFNKINVTVSDNFIMIRGVWVPSGEVVTIGDFNKVRIKSERFGSVFNVQGAEAFNMFISNADLEEDFHYWFEVEGFDKLVEDTWNEAPVDDSNAMCNMLKKLKYLKEKLCAWNNEKKRSSSNSKVKLQEELIKLDTIIDKGEGTGVVVNRRSFIIKSLQDMKNLQSLEVAQKSIIK